MLTLEWGHLGDSGEVWVVFGKAAPFSRSLNLSHLNGCNGFTMNGISALDQAGVSVSGAGDISQDV